MCAMSVWACMVRARTYMGGGRDGGGGQRGGGRLGGGKDGGGKGGGGLGGGWVLSDVRVGLRVDVSGWGPGGT